MTHKLGHLKQIYFVHNFMSSSSLFFMGLVHLNRAGESTSKLLISMASQLTLVDVKAQLELLSGTSAHLHLGPLLQ